MASSEIAVVQLDVITLCLWIHYLDIVTFNLISELLLEISRKLELNQQQLKQNGRWLEDLTQEMSWRKGRANCIFLFFFEDACSFYGSLTTELELAGFSGVCVLNRKNCAVLILLPIFLNMRSASQMQSAEQLTDVSPTEPHYNQSQIKISWRFDF